MSKRKKERIESPETPLETYEENQKGEDEPKDQSSDLEINNHIENSEEEASQTSEQETDKMQKELEKTQDQLVRLQAEFVNYKRRVEKEKMDLYVYGCENLAKDLLPVIDNIERALESIKEKESGYYQGIDLVRQQMMQALEKHEITEIKAIGEPFDMLMHHAVMTEPCETEEHKNTVADVMQKGYKMKNRVLRPSMVKVYQ
jgi:molecular chaperone GrpE